MALSSYISMWLLINRFPLKFQYGLRGVFRKLKFEKKLDEECWRFYPMVISEICGSEPPVSAITDLIAISKHLYIP
jgi:hypothetical protein